MNHVDENLHLEAETAGDKVPPPRQPSWRSGEHEWARIDLVVASLEAKCYEPSLLGKCNYDWAQAKHLHVKTAAAVDLRPPETVQCTW